MWFLTSLDDQKINLLSKEHAQYVVDVLVNVSKLNTSVQEFKTTDVKIAVRALKHLFHFLK